MPSSVTVTPSDSSVEAISSEAARSTVSAARRVRLVMVTGGSVPPGRISQRSGVSPANRQTCPSPAVAV